ncbi:hypothetical protein T11_1436 [Trichinella zimbabwensis]|uniref:Uncharacterized protein n=1 Tax=Trichinella zimbabwensis TaxID=268475 RepID=A0A0V1HD18_9BILA|nr:hypothetical protein T11_1436 [Trichinella zimbabwensis]
MLRCQRNNLTMSSSSSSSSSLSSSSSSSLKQKINIKKKYKFSFHQWIATDLLCCPLCEEDKKCCLRKYRRKLFKNFRKALSQISMDRCTSPKVTFSLVCFFEWIFDQINSNCEKLTLENRFCRTFEIPLSDVIVKII